MNRLSLTARLVSAATACTITFALLGTVFRIAEPQRSELLAKLERSQPQTSQATLAMAAATVAAHVGN